MKKILFIILLSSVNIFSQITVEEEVTTETIDLFASPERESLNSKNGIATNSKKTSIAVWGNILIPGLGSKYLGQEKKAFAYFATEAVAVVALIFTKSYSKSTFDNSRSFATLHANTVATYDATSIYWKHIGYEEAKTIDEYNSIQELNRTPENKYTKNSDYWKWSDDSYQEEYRNMRNLGEKLKTASSFCIGAMVLNRAISFIDARISSKRQISSPFTGVSVTSDVSSSSTGGSLSIVKKF